MVVVASGKTVAALNHSSGASVWQYSVHNPLNAYGRLSVSYAENLQLVIVTGEHGVFGLDGHTGAMRWHRQVSKRNLPIYARSTILDHHNGTCILWVGTSDGRLDCFQFDRDGCSFQWSFHTVDSAIIASQPALLKKKELVGH
jgi:outer membrane protein assembly factor BamB